MKLVLTGGGTAGHINPALALADYIKKVEPSSEIIFIGGKNGMEEKLVPASGYKFHGITISGFSRKKNLYAIRHNIKTVRNVVKSYFQSKKILHEFKPDLCLGTGGYVSGPVLRAAKSLRIPYYLHESNAFPGVTTKLLAKDAKKIFLVSEYAKNFFKDKNKIIITGNPIREKIVNPPEKIAAKNLLNLDEKPVVLSFGGSLGAQKINDTMAEIILKNKNYNFIHAYGKKGEKFKIFLEKKGILNSKNKNLYVREYINNMPTCLAAADLIVCRAGAITLSEIAMAGKAAILVPSPYVAENHQFHNAKALADHGAAILIEEKDFTSSNLEKEIKQILENRDLKEKLEINIKKFAIKNACERVYNQIKNYK